MPSEIRLGDVQDDVLQSLEAKVATDSNGDFVVKDSNDNVVGKYNESASQWEIGSGKIEQFSIGPKYQVSLDGNRSPPLVITDQKGSVVESGGVDDLATLLQSIDDSVDVRWSAHFSPPVNTSLQYTVDQQIQLTNNVFWRGPGRNQANIVTADSLSSDMILLDTPDETQIPITTFANIKFLGSSGLSAGVSGFRNVNHNELIHINCEIRGFTDNGLHINPASGVNLRWNYALGTWFLDNGNADVNFDGSSGGIVDDWTFSGCQLLATNATPGILFDNVQGNMTNISWTGGRMRGTARPIVVRDSEDLYATFDGVTFLSQNTRSVELEEPSTARNIHLTISDCNFRSDPNSVPNEHVVIRDNCNEVYLDNNDYDPNVSGREIATVGSPIVWHDGTLFRPTSAITLSDRHAGKTIVDESASPTELYFVNESGNLVGPFTT